MIRATYLVQCDGCGGLLDPGRPREPLRVGRRFASLAEANRAAHRTGWVHGKLIRCPKCKKSTIPRSKK